MNKELSFLEKLIYRLLYTLLLAVVFLFCVGPHAGLKSLGIWHFITAVCMICLFSIFSLSRGKGRIFCGLFTGLLLVCIILVVGREMAITFLESYFKWLVGKDGWQIAWIFGYGILQTILLTLGGCLLEMILERYERLRLIFAGLMIVGLLVAMFTKTPLSHAGAVGAFLYPVLICIEWIQGNWKKHRNRNLKVHTLWITPFLTAYFAAMLLMPAPEKPYDWQFVKDVYHQVQRSFSKLNDFMWSLRGDGISIALSGFSEDAHLFGGVSSEKVREVMKIDTQIDLKTNIYLSGKTFDTFDGTQWLHTDEELPVMRVGESDIFSETMIYEDTAKTVQVVETYGELALKNYLSKTTLRISYPKIDKGTLFLPIKTEYLKEKEDDYVAVYYQMNLDAEPFYELLAQIHEENSTSDFAGHEVYSQEIILSEDVRNYLSEITRGAKNDVEKLRLIEKELSSFNYNRIPGSLPEYVVDESSFLDYFLLESRKGFCTHFATAFVLLARAEGIPARYVQGFCVPQSGEKEIAVYSDMAHAWPEVYINGVGFIPFEPTPGYGEMRYTPWKMQIDEPYGNAAGFQPDINLQENASETEISSGNSVEEASTAPPKDLLKKAAYVLPILAGAAFIVCFLDKVWEKFRYRKMILSEKFKAYAEVNFRLWGVLDIHRETNETLEEFSSKVKRRVDFEKEMTQFILLYEEVLYGEKEVTADMFATAKRVNRLLFDAVKRKNTLLYWFKRLQFYPYGINI